jgi:hypothetical protein
VHIAKALTALRSDEPEISELTPLAFFVLLSHPPLPGVIRGILTIRCAEWAIGIFKNEFDLISIARPIAERFRKASTKDIEKM